MPLAAETIDDLVEATLQSYGTLNFSMIAQDLPNYIVMNQMLRKDAVKLDASQTMAHILQVTQSDTATDVGLFDDDALSVQDNLKSIEVPWRNTTNNFIYDVREKALNGSPEQLVDLIGSRRMDMMLGLAEHLERQFWKAPTSTADDTTPWGIQYWLKLAADGEGRGFNGDDIAPFTGGPGGLSSNTYSKWAHYNAEYDAFTDDDFASEMRRAYRACNFMSPIKTLSNDVAQGHRYKLFTGEETIEGLIAMARAQNDNIGRDIAAFDDTVVFKRLPFQWVPQIDVEWDPANGQYPVFGIDTKHLKVAIHTKNNFRQTGPEIVAGKHNVRAVFVDLSWNMICTDRRRQFVLNRTP